MADRMLFVGWGARVRGREERGIEVLNEAIGICGRMQQDGRIEKFEVRLLGPNGSDLAGYIEIHGTAAQIAAVKEDEEFLRNTMDANQVTEGLRHADGWVDEGIARVMEMFEESVSRASQDP
jgi:hypothetical protein